MWKAKLKAGHACKGCPNFPLLLSNTIPQLPACRFECHSSVLHQQCLGDSWLVGGIQLGWVGVSMCLFRVGQTVFNFLSTLCTTAGWWGRKDSILIPVLLADPSVPTSHTCEWQFPSPKGTTAARQGISCIYPWHLKAIFFFLSQRVGFYHSTVHRIVFPNIPLRRMYFSKYCHSLL